MMFANLNREGPQVVESQEREILRVKKPHFVEFVYLRAVAIILVVLGHSIFSVEDEFPIMIENITKGATAIFVFISGYFLHAAFYIKFKYVSFIKKKVKNILFPFYFVSAITIVILLIGLALFKNHNEAAKSIEISVFLSRGFILYPHWYVRFIMVVFLLSPLYIKFVDVGPRGKIVILLFSSLISSLIHRPLGDIDVLQSVIYFTPYYLFGIYFSIYKDWFYRNNRLVFWVSIVGFFLCVITQAFVFPHAGNYHKGAFTYAGIDLMFFQKAFLCVMLIEICKWFARRYKPIRLLSVLADASFAIYFIHFLFTGGFGYFFSRWLSGSTDHALIISLLATLLIFSFSISISFAVAKTFKSMVGDRSGLLIGW